MIVQILAGLAVLAVFYVISLHNFLLFHTMAELFSVIVAGGIFMLAWNSRRNIKNGYLLFIGLSFLFVGAVDFLHALAYEGMGVFPDLQGANAATQLWIIARFIQAVSFLAAPMLTGRKIRTGPVFAAYFAVTSLLLLSVFQWHNFPACYIEGVGLTPFKKISEYAIVLMLAASIYILHRHKDSFDPGVLKLLYASIAAIIASELCFTFYVGVYDPFIVAGHFLKITGFFLIYKAIIETGLVRPQDLLFRELKQREQMLYRSKMEVEAANGELRQFAYIVSHDLKEPLRTVAGFAGLLKRKYSGVLDDKGREFITYIMEGTKRMDELISGLLAYSRVGTTKRDFAPVDMAAALEKAVLNLKMAIEESGARVESGQKNLPVVKGDATQLVQLFQNLLGNAIKYRREEPPRIAIRAERAEGEKNPAGCEQMGQGWLFLVSDNGIGIRSEDYERIFIVFQRLHEKGKYPGTGIGLAICKKIVERHGGCIGVKSEPGKGSTFYFGLPD
ncbi:MAG: ATP-binding protein [Nitrospiraceae bacterium]|nr:ATP-binding protein [Nitrospiraceae bacterium]